MAIKPFMVKDLLPEEGKIEWAVKRLRNNRSGGGVEDAGGTHQGVARDGKES